MEKESVFTNLDLANFLKAEFGKDINFDYMKMLANKETVKGSYKEANFLILFEDNNYLKLYTKNTTMFDELKTVLNVVMNNCGPIISYDLVSKDDINQTDILTAMEWNVVCKEERIRDVINGRADDKDSKCINVSLFDGRSVESYTEDEETKKEKNNKVKIFGVYPGCLNNPEYYLTCSEDELYFAISTLSKIVFCHQGDSDKESNTAILEEVYALEYCISLTRRFGVELPEPEIGKHIIITPSYEAWFNWWNKYFQLYLTDEQIREYRILRAKNKDTSAFRPMGDWRDSIKKDSVKTK